jgi:hypothetical protein
MILLGAHALTHFVSVHADIPYTIPGWEFSEDIAFALSHAGFALAGKVPRLISCDCRDRDEWIDKSYRRWLRFLPLALFSAGHFSWLIRVAFRNGYLAAARSGNGMKAIVLTAIASMAFSTAYQAWHSFHKEVRNRPDHKGLYAIAAGWFDNCRQWRIRAENVEPPEGIEPPTFSLRVTAIL